MTAIIVFPCLGHVMLFSPLCIAPLASKYSILRLFASVIYMYMYAQAIAHFCVRLLRNNL